MLGNVEISKARRKDDMYHVVLEGYTFSIKVSHLSKDMTTCLFRIRMLSFREGNQRQIERNTEGMSMPLMKEIIQANICLSILSIVADRLVLILLLNNTPYPCIQQRSRIKAVSDATINPHSFPPATFSSLCLTLSFNTLKIPATTLSRPQSNSAPCGINATAVFDPSNLLTIS